jgi:hypothetical protein
MSDASITKSWRGSHGLYYLNDMGCFTIKTPLSKRTTPFLMYILVMQG